MLVMSDHAGGDTDFIQPLGPDLEHGVARGRGGTPKAAQKKPAVPAGCSKPRGRPKGSQNKPKPSKAKEDSS